MRRALPEALVVGYEGRLAAVATLGDDAHVLAAAVHARADVIVTDNVRDFPSAVVAPYGIAVQTADQFLVRLWNLASDEVARAIVEQARDTRRPSLSPDDVLSGLAPTVPRFLALVRGSIELRAAREGE